MTYEQYFLDTGCASAAIDARTVNTFYPGDFFGEVAFIATAASILEVVYTSSSKYL